MAHLTSNRECRVIVTSFSSMVQEISNAEVFGNRLEFQLISSIYQGGLILSFYG